MKLENMSLAGYAMEVIALVCYDFQGEGYCEGIVGLVRGMVKTEDSHLRQKVQNYMLFTVPINSD